MKYRDMTPEQREAKKAYMRKYYAEHGIRPKPGRLTSSYPFDRHQWKRIKSRLEHLVEDYGWPKVEQLIEVVKSEYQTKAVEVAEE